MRRVCLSSSSTYIATLSVFCCSMASRRGLSHRQECGNHVYRYAEFEKIRKWLNLGNRLVLTKLKWPQNLLYFLSSYSSYFLLVLYLTPSSTNAYTFPSLHSSYFIPYLSHHLNLPQWTWQLVVLLPGIFLALSQGCWKAVESHVSRFLKTHSSISINTYP